MSRTRSPSNGSAGGAAAVRGAIACVRAVRAASIECSPSRGAGSGGRRRAAPSRKGGRGFAAPSRGLATNVSRARKCSNVVTFEPLAIGALGIRKADARLEHLFDGVVGDPRVDGRRQRRAVEEELRILHPLGMSDHGAEVEPLLPGPAPEPDQPVAGRPDARRRDEPASSHRSSELVVERHRVVGEAHRQRLEHRHVDELALRVGAPTRRQGPDRAEERRRATPRSGHRRTRAHGRVCREPARRSLPTTPAA